MKHRAHSAVVLATAVTIATGLPAHAQAGQAREIGDASRTVPVAADDQSGEIIVTANKRQENLQNVGLSIQAIGGEALADRKISSLADIAKAVPGLTFASTANSTPVYTLRGVGFFDSTLSSYPDVSLYIDQVPLPFPVTATLSAFDLERLEVLKGPQGTLFGNNATGGAINYIAAKPSATFGTGGTISYSRFNTIEADGYVTGPITSTLNGRLAVKVKQGDGWQQSYTRDSSLGKADQLAARLLLDWKPTDRLSVSLNVNGWRDKSEPQAPQFVNIYNQGLTIPPAIAAYPKAPANPRAADWSDGALRPRADNNLIQAALRVDYDLTDEITLTSLSNYIRYHHDQILEGDGTSIEDLDTTSRGKIRTLSQELRISNGSRSGLRWVAGFNYENSNVDEFNGVYYSGSANAIPGVFERAYNFSIQRMRNYAGFGNIEYDVTPQITLKGGLRQTWADRTSRNGNTADAPETAFMVSILEAYRSLVLGYSDPTIPNPPMAGGITSADPATALPGLYQASLNQKSTSWSVGANWKITPTVLLFANVSKGYKAGGFPTLSAAFWSQYTPVSQESLIDYEAGFKAQFFDRKVTLNGAAFYYDYSSKQLRSKIVDPFFGILDGLKNVPKSRIFGFEQELVVRPVSGLQLYLSATYLNSKVLRYNGISGSTIDPATGFFTPVFSNLAGSRLPFAPKWQVASGFSYEAPISELWAVKMGVDVHHQSSSTSVLASNLEMEQTKVKAYTVTDGRIGIASRDDRWSITVWGKNLFNKYYWTNSIQSYDTIVRYAGRPAEYGITLGLKY